MARYEVLFKDSVFKDLQAIPKTDLRMLSVGARPPRAIVCSPPAPQRQCPPGRTPPSTAPSPISAQCASPGGPGSYRPTPASPRLHRTMIVPTLQRGNAVQTRQGSVCVPADGRELRGHRPGCRASPLDHSLRAWCVVCRSPAPRAIWFQHRCKTTNPSFAQGLAPANPPACQLSDGGATIPPPATLFGHPTRPIPAAPLTLIARRAGLLKYPQTLAQAL